MRSPTILAPTFLFVVLMTPPAADSQTRDAADVALASFAVASDDDRALRTAADSCLERLTRGLADQGVAVVRRPALSEKTLASAGPARWAVLGRVGREKGMISVELRLMDVASGEEMRSYFNSDKDPLVVADVGKAAAGRIAAFVKEQKGSPPGP
jgi:TolB-like protein